jgi:Na+-transporting methylmalonyl-CoA/oxaloacetate decarboxylase beta subunit
MLSSYIESAITIGAKPQVPVPVIKKFIDKILKNEEEQKIYVTTHGKLHKNEGRVVHLIAYPE